MTPGFLHCTFVAVAEDGKVLAAAAVVPRMLHIADRACQALCRRAALAVRVEQQHLNRHKHMVKT